MNSIEEIKQYCSTIDSVMQVVVKDNDTLSLISSMFPSMEIETSDDMREGYNVYILGTRNLNTTSAWFNLTFREIPFL